VSWRFDTKANRLQFKTKGGVQPKALLMANPTRLIIDLPGTNMKRRTVRKPLKGGLHSLRVGQFDNRTTRLVIELKPGYTLDHKQILFRGATPERWSVQIPSPKQIQQLSKS
jgi:N-acetylmuramoyl-L-alanine amidase